MESLKLLPYSNTYIQSNITLARFESAGRSDAKPVTTPTDPNPSPVSFLPDSQNQYSPSSGYHVPIVRVAGLFGICSTPKKEERWL